MIGFVLEVISRDDDNMIQIIRGIVNYKIVINHRPSYGTIKLYFDCDHYHIKKGDKINMRRDEPGIANPVFHFPTVVKSTHGNVIEFEERTMKANE